MAEYYVRVIVSGGIDPSLLTFFLEKTMSSVNTYTYELSYGSYLEIQHALSCRAGRLLQSIENNKKWLIKHPDSKVANDLSKDYPIDLDKVKTAFKELTGRDMNIKSLKEIYLAE
jgi:hypothetical protein|tara:strand:+ start:1150 stop:1494 length:345 start_codon:yes stop_codon:yes gene_type:complete